MQYFNQLCLDSAPSVLGFFDFSIAPPLLFYSYIPILIIMLVFGIYVLVQSNYTLQSKLLFSITVSFAVWILLILIQWIAAYVNVVHFAWQILIIPEILIYIFSLYFVYVFIEQKDLSYSSKLILTLVGIPLVLLLSSQHNIISFNLESCEGNIGDLWSYAYILELTLIVCICLILINKLKRIKDNVEKWKILILTTGTILFLGLFFLSNFTGELTKSYEFNFFGPLGMVGFIAILAYLTVRYKAFNISLIGAQALVISVVVLIGSEFFFIQSYGNRILVAITLVITGTIGLVLVRSVKREVNQREQIQKLAEDLKVANVRLKEVDAMKTEFVSLATHQIRAPLTAIKGYVSLITEGDYGPISNDVKTALDVVHQSTNNLVAIVGDFLDVSRIEQGRMKYDYSDFDLGKLVEEVVTEYKPNVDKRGLGISYTADKGEKYDVHADMGKVKQVIGNIVDNSIKYTPKGSITVSISKKGNKNLIKIADTGIGIKKEVIPKLFQKFTRAEDANKTNILGTGLGLYVAKNMIEAMGGKVWAESEGDGKGSQFYIEL